MRYKIITKYPNEPNKIQEKKNKSSKKNGEKDLDDFIFKDENIKYHSER